MTQPIVRPRVATHAGHDARLDKIERALATGQETLRPPPVIAGVGGADFVLCPSDGTTRAKSRADVVLPGTDVGDVAAIQAANDEVAAGPFGGGILLLSGTVQGDAGLILLDDGVSISGMGVSTTIFFGLSGGFRANGHDVTIANMGLWDGYGNAIDDFGSHVNVTLHRLFLNNAGVGARGEGWLISALGIYGGGLQLDGHSHVVTGCRSDGLNLDMSSCARCLIEACVFDMQNDTLYFGGDIAGTPLVGDNTMTGCLISGISSPSNTFDLVQIDGTRNSFVNNVVRSASSVNKPRYGVNVLSTALDCRVESNDTRAGVGAWGTAAYTDAGTGTLTTNPND